MSLEIKISERVDVESGPEIRDFAPVSQASQNDI